MKKVIINLASLSILFFAISCSEDDAEPMNSGNNTEDSNTPDDGTPDDEPSQNDDSTDELSEIAAAVSDVSFEQITTNAGDKQEEEDDSNQRTLCSDEHQVVWEYEDEEGSFISYQSHFNVDDEPISECDLFDLDSYKVAFIDSISGENFLAVWNYQEEISNTSEIVDGTEIQIFESTSYDTAKIVVDTLAFGLEGTSAFRSESGVNFNTLEITYNAKITMNVKVSFSVADEEYYFMVELEETIEGLDGAGVVEEEEHREEYDLYNSADEKIGEIHFTEETTEVYDLEGNLVS